MQLRYNPIKAVFLNQNSQDITGRFTAYLNTLVILFPATLGINEIFMEKTLECAMHDIEFLRKYDLSFKELITRLCN